MKRVIAIAAVATALLATVAYAGSNPNRFNESRPAKVVLIALPGVSWSDVRNADVPNIRQLLVSTAALSARTAGRAPDIARGYLTLGAGNPAFVPEEDVGANLAFEARDTFETGTAHDAVVRRTGRPQSGDVVQVNTAALQQFQERRFYGSEVGRLGETLQNHGQETAVVSAADIALRPTDEQKRRAAVLALMDADGAVDVGKLDGLLRPDRLAPFGVATSRRAFLRAAEHALGAASVVLLDIGETSRADEYVQYLAPDRISDVRRKALLRTDRIVGGLLPLLRAGKAQMVLTFSPSGPTSDAFIEHLGVLGAVGRRGNANPKNLAFDRSWLTSATTRRQGMVVLSDIAPTVLDAMGYAKPDSMVGTPIREGSPRRDGVDDLIELDTASSVRERFAAGAFWVISILVSLLGLLAFVVFLGRRRGRTYRLLVAVAYFSLAVFPAAHIIRAFEFWWLGVIGAHLLLYAVAAALAAAAWLLPGPRWSGGIALMILTVLLFGSDVAIGGPLQMNGVFGHSPLVAGRFYGISNPGYTILFAATVLGVTGLAEYRGHRLLPPWGIVALVLLLPLIGLPSTGADIGGLLAGIPAIGVTIALGRGLKIRWRTVVILAAVAVLLTVGLSFIDLLRPPEVRTHLGRFAELLAGRDASGLLTVLERKGAASLHSLTVTRWTYFIPVGIAVLVLLLLRPRGILREVLPRRPLLRAGLWGTLVTGALGFAVNDSGISIPALALAFTVPFLVLIAVDTVDPRKHGKT